MSTREINRRKLADSKKIKVGSGVMIKGLDTSPSNGHMVGTVGTVIKIHRRLHGQNMYDVKGLNGVFKGSTLVHDRKDLFVL